MFNLRGKSPKILVVGDLMIDHYVNGVCERISPEAPVQIINVKDETLRLGGACNVVNNLISLGAKVDVCGVIGKDDIGKWLVNELSHLGADISCVFVDKTRPTIKKTRILATNQQVLRIDKEDNKPVDSALIKNIKEDLELKINAVDCVIISDYAKGLLDLAFTRFIIDCAHHANKIILCDPKGSDYSKYKDATLLTPNKKEAALACGFEISSEADVIKAGMQLKKMCNLATSIITLSEDGIGIIENNKLLRTPTFAKEIYDVTGAGDTLISALAFALSCNLDIYRASEFANFAAAVSVGKIGSAIVTHEEVDTLYSASNVKHMYEHEKIVDKKHLVEELESLRGNGYRIVFTNGCFDILHRGHIDILSRAKKLGDILVVGLNSDASTRRLKGAGRPINNEGDRAYMLSMLDFIDYVVIFNEDTPLNLVKAIKPDILVKGEDYKDKEVVGSEYSKEVALLSLVEGKSSTSIIEKILSYQKVKK